MTLNQTLLTSDLIFQSADFRLVDGDSGSVIDDSSTKVVTVHYPTWDGLVTYTGVGRFRNRDTAHWLVDWVTGLTDAHPDEVAERIRDRGTAFLRRIASRHRHTFVFAAFVDGRPRAYVISNFETCSGRPLDSPADELRIDSCQMKGSRPLSSSQAGRPPSTDPSGVAFFVMRPRDPSRQRRYATSC